MTQEEYNQMLADIDYAKQPTEGFTFSDWADYLSKLIDAIDHTSDQIYEKYRILVDCFRTGIKTALACEDKSDKKAVRTISEVIIKGCDKDLLLDRYRIMALSIDDAFTAEEEEKFHSVSSKIKSEGETGILKMIYKSARSVTFEIADGGRYYTKEEYTVRVNKKPVMSTNTVITSVFRFDPQSAYEITVEKKDGTVVGTLTFITDYEYTTLNVKAFGAKGDGVTDDTRSIQAAIMACPKDSRVLIPAGKYKVASIFLKSDLNIELAKDAELLASTNRADYAYLPGCVQTTDETDEYHLGTWEGNPLPCFTGIICGINCENVRIYGEGTINGCGSKENWWNNPKIMNIAWRPRLFFINRCKGVTLQGVKFTNSPSWTLHPAYSDDLKFLNVTVENPSDSPNTDGLDPESCAGILIAGVRFSLGDDCIAVKSGKFYMGHKYKRPTQDVRIYQCLMENGHGAVTLGSEIAAGVKNFVVDNCLFSHTDRGLRIKTRRGRGRDSVIDGIVFENLTMDHVMTPFVINSFYFCDPDGKTDYVQSREPHPVDEATPYIGSLAFKNIEATNCHVAAAHYDGLPEEPIKEVIMENVNISYCDNPKCDVPAMSLGVEACTKRGIFANNVDRLVLKNVNIKGQLGDELIAENVGEIIR